jgi:hypothetical protein
MVAQVSIVDLWKHCRSVCRVVAEVVVVGGASCWASQQARGLVLLEVQEGFIRAGAGGLHQGRCRRASSGQVQEGFIRAGQEGSSQGSRAGQQQLFTTSCAFWSSVPSDAWSSCAKPVAPACRVCLLLTPFVIACRISVIGGSVAAISRARPLIGKVNQKSHHQSYETFSRAGQMNIVAHQTPP